MKHKQSDSEHSFSCFVGLWGTWLHWLCHSIQVQVPTTTSAETIFDIINISPPWEPKLCPHIDKVFFWSEWTLLHVGDSQLTDWKIRPCFHLQRFVHRFHRGRMNPPMNPFGNMIFPTVIPNSSRSNSRANILSEFHCWPFKNSLVHDIHLVVVHSCKFSGSCSAFIWLAVMLLCKFHDLFMNP